MGYGMIMGIQSAKTRVFKTNTLQINKKETQKSERNKEEKKKKKKCFFPYMTPKLDFEDHLYQNPDPELAQI